MNRVGMVQKVFLPWYRKGNPQWTGIVKGSLQLEISACGNVKLHFDLVEDSIDSMQRSRLRECRCHDGYLVLFA